MGFRQAGVDQLGMAMTYPTPGRGAWTLKGGLLPAKPGSTSRAGYYRLAGADENPIGSQYLSGFDTGHDAYVVMLAVRQIQELVDPSLTVDGWFGRDTDKAVRAAQKRWGLEADGIVGRATMRAALMREISDSASHEQVPMQFLGGLLMNESALDPAAVGINGQDHGIAQINLGAHPEVSLEKAMDTPFSITFTAEDLSHVHDVWLERTNMNPWDIAIANHNSPALAKRWAQEGRPPFVQGRAFQIEEYVQRVKTAW